MGIVKYLKNGFYRTRKNRVFLFPFWLFIFTCFWKWLPWASDGSLEDRLRKLWWSFIDTVILCFSTPAICLHHRGQSCHPHFVCFISSHSWSLDMYFFHWYLGLVVYSGVHECGSPKRINVLECKYPRICFRASQGLFCWLITPVA